MFYGRAAEELAALERELIPCEVVTWCVLQNLPPLDPDLEPLMAEQRQISMWHVLVQRT